MLPTRIQLLFLRLSIGLIVLFPATATAQAPSDALTVPGVLIQSEPTSSYMIGSVSVGVIFLGEYSTDTYMEIRAGLDWWKSMDSRAALNFVSEVYITPVDSSSEESWASSAMARLGYHEAVYFWSVHEFNKTMITRNQTDWGFTIFVLPGSRLSNGSTGYAYLGGPFMVVASQAPQLDMLVAHEVGHIFHAYDQYASAKQPCDKVGGWLSVENQNSQYGSCLSDMPSIMRGVSQPYLDPYAAGQIGWRDSDLDGIFDPVDIYNNPVRRVYMPLIVTRIFALPSTQSRKD